VTGMARLHKNLMFLHSAPLIVAAMAAAACGQVPHEKYGGQRIPGEWQEPILKGCSAEVKMRLPARLLDVQQDWRLKAGSDNCPGGNTSLLGSLQEFKAVVSPKTAAKLEALDQLAVKRIAEMKARDPGFDPNTGWGGAYCRTQAIQIAPNHRYLGKSLVTRTGMPSVAGKTYELQQPTLLPFGLLTLGQIMTHDEQRLANGAVVKVNWRPIGITEYWHAPPGNGRGTITFSCSRSYRRPDDEFSGGCQVRKDHSEAVRIQYRMCAALLPEWRQVDTAIAAIVDDLVVSERLVPFVRQTDDPNSDDLGRY
jgi:hypothetical protein